MHEQLMGLVRSLFTSISFNDHAVVSVILAEAAAAGLLQQLLTAADHSGMCPLHAAAHSGDSHILELLLAAGTPVDARAANGDTALVMAARQGHLQSVRVLLSNGAAVDEEGPYPVLDAEGADCYELELVYWVDFAAVTAAVMGGSAAVLTELLRVAPPGTADDFVQLAMAQGQWHLLQVLFDAGANKGAALREAAEYGSGPALQVMQDLLDAGVSLDAGEPGNTALHAAAYKGSLKGVQMLLAAGAALDARDVGRYTPLHCAARRNDDASAIEVMGVLLRAAAPGSTEAEVLLAVCMDDQQRGRKTPLDVAACAGNTAVVQLLCSHLAGALQEDFFGRALCSAVAEKHVDIVQVLLAAGADPLYRGSCTVAALYMYSRRVQQAAAVQDGSSYLVVAGTPLGLAASCAHPETIECFVDPAGAPQLTTTDFVYAAAEAMQTSRLRRPPYHLSVIVWRQQLREAVSMLLQAAIQRSDAESVYKVLLSAEVVSEDQQMWSRLLGAFAGLMLSMYSKSKDMLRVYDSKQGAVRQMCVCVAQNLAAGQEPAE